MKQLIIIPAILLVLSLNSLFAQTVVKMDMPPQADEKLNVVALFDEEIPEGIPVVLGLMGYDVAGGIEPYFFEWVLNGNVISTDDIVVFTPHKGDNLSLKVTDKNKCRASTTFNLKVARLSKSAGLENESNIKIYPTVFTGSLHIDLPVELDTRSLVRIFDLSGSKVFEKYITGSSTLDVSLNKGTYFVSVRNEKVHKVEKIIAK